LHHLGDHDQAGRARKGHQPLFYGALQPGQGEVGPDGQLGDPGRFNLSRRSRREGYLLVHWWWSLSLVRMSWWTPECLPDGRRQAGDRHLNFHKGRDNLGGRPVGIISLGDLAIERGPASTLADISAAPSNT
jgi:hypothetical protein